MSNINIIPIDRMATPGVFKKKFVLFPWKIYRSKENRAKPWAKAWCPPLIIDVMDKFNTKINVKLKRIDFQAFIAERDGEVVGRITAQIYHGHLETFNDSTGFWGWFECINDQAVAEALFNRAQDWLKQKGMKRMLGPYSFTINDTFGMKCDGGADYPAGYEIMPMVMMPHNPPYYNELCTQYAMTKAQDLYSYHLDMEKGISDRVRRVARLVEQRLERKSGRIEYRRGDLKQWDELIEYVWEIHCDAWETNWGTVAWTKEEFDHEGKDLKMLVEEDFIWFVFVNNEVAGFIMALPDLNEVQSKINGRLLPFGIIKLLWGLKVAKSYNRSRCLLMGIKKKFQKRGLEAPLIEKLYEAGKKHNIKEGELSWILESNIPMRRGVEPFSTGVWMTFRAYEKPIQ